MPTPWDHIRAALITANLALMTLAATPSTDGMLTEKRRKDPATLEAVAPWADLVVGLGLAQDRADATEWLFETGETLSDIRRGALGPSKRYHRFFGIGQSWRMFGTAPSAHGRYELHVRHRGSPEWTPVFVEASADHQWSAPVMNQSRTRSLRSNFAERGLRGRYHGFSKWCALRLMAEDPEIIAVRAQLTQVQIPPPGVLRKTGKLVEKKPYWPLEFKRDDPR